MNRETLSSCFVMFFGLLSCSAPVRPTGGASGEAPMPAAKPSTAAEKDFDTAGDRDASTSNIITLEPESEVDNGKTQETKVSQVATPIPSKPKALSFLSEFVIMTAEGSHTVVKFPYTPPAGYVAWPAAADCAGGTCFGDITANLKYVTGVPTVDKVKVITAVALSAKEGDHVIDGGTCPAGYTQLISYTDCGAGRCQGHQKLCGMIRNLADLKVGDQVVHNLYKTPYGTHKPGGDGCPVEAGFKYELIGSHADCGMGICSGNQLICVAYNKVTL